MDLAPQILPREKGDTMDYMIQLELLVRQRTLTQRELNLYKGNNDLRRAEIDRLTAEIDRMMAKCP